MTDTITIAALKALIDTADEFRNAFWFHPPMSANSRRDYEKRHTHAMIEWDEGGHHYSAAYTVTCSCSRVYATGIYTRDGKTTTLTAIRNSYKRMTKEVGK